MEILASSRIMNDTDVLGAGGDNIGIIIEKNKEEKAIKAIAVKFDPGFALN